MIVVKSPLRISLGGGGTDLPNYYRNKGGQVISTTINKYVYIIINKPFTKEFILKYSDNEKVKNINQIKHSIFRNILMEKKYQCDSLEITSLADIPAGTGLGSSGAFTTALIKGLNAYFNLNDNKELIASYATKIERKSINLHLGLQDQYASSYGGLNFFNFNEFNTKVTKVNLDKTFKKRLGENFLLYYTGIDRKSSPILQKQNNDIKKQGSIIKKLDRIKEIARETYLSLKDKDIEKVGHLLNEQWHLKKSTSPTISNKKIDDLIEYGLKNGACGCKLLGAGSGGFLLFLTKNNKNKSLLKKNMKLNNIMELPFEFENKGVQILVNK